MYKKIIISKISDHGGTEKTPTHALKVMVEGRKPITVGKLWTRESEYGKYLSGVMQDEFKGEKDTFPAFVIVEEKHIEELKAKIAELEQAIPKPTGTTYEDNGVIKNIPF
jgi:hypothetical protein